MTTESIDGKTKVSFSIPQFISALTAIVLATWAVGSQLHGIEDKLSAANLKIEKTNEKIETLSASLKGNRWTSQNQDAWVYAFWTRNGRRWDMPYSQDIKYQSE